MIVRLDAKSVVYKRIKERIFSASTQGMGFPSGSVVKNLPINAGDVGLIPGSGRPLEKEMATHSSSPAWKKSQGKRAWRFTVHGVARVGPDLATKQQLKEYLRRDILAISVVAFVFYASFLCK